ncbi:hypothetical protein D3C85_149290 [compost metagenome]|jgi:hypothetical protein
MSNGNEKARRDPMCLDDSKLRLYGTPIQDGAYPPSLRIKLIENNPCIEVDLGMKTEKGYPMKIEGPMDPQAFSTLLVLLEKVAAYPNAISFEVENWGHPFIWDRDQGKSIRSKDRVVISKTQVQKREDGVVTIALAAKKMQLVEFVFQPGEFHPITQNGQAAPLKITSPVAAAGWATAMREIFMTNFAINWKEPEFQKKKRLERMQNAQNGGGQRQGGGGNNYNRNGGGGGGNNYNGGQQQQQQRPAPAPAPASDSFDDDIPF